MKIATVAQMEVVFKANVADCLNDLAKLAPGNIVFRLTDGRTLEMLQDEWQELLRLAQAGHAAEAKRRVRSPRR